MTPAWPTSFPETESRPDPGHRLWPMSGTTLHAPRGINSTSSWLTGNVRHKLYITEIYIFILVYECICTYNEITKIIDISDLKKEKIFNKGP